MLKKIRLLFSFDRKTLLLLGEAFLYLGWVRVQLFFPFALIAPSLGLKTQETPDDLEPDEAAIIKNIASAVNIMSRYTFWESQCLVRAIAGMRILKRRGIGSTLYLGTAKDQDGQLIAHAWLRCGPIYLTGADVMNRFIVVETFAQMAGTRQRSIP